MPSLLTDIPRWVAEAPRGQQDFRRAIHCILDAIATDNRLRSLLCMKGGILMALHYDSPRFTTDIDFSHPEPFTEGVEREVLELLRTGLAAAPERLGYDIDCRLQSHDVQPGRDKTFINVRMKIGYAKKGTAEHRRLMNNSSPSVVTVDYNFRESIPDVEEVEIGEDGTLRVYALPTLVAEKLRSLLQQPIRGRTRRQDVYDINYLLENRPELQTPDCQSTVLSDVIIKCNDRYIVATQQSIDDPRVRELAQIDYATLAAELIETELPDFDAIFDRVATYYRSLPW